MGSTCGPAGASGGPPVADPRPPGSSGFPRRVRPCPVLGVWTRSCFLTGCGPEVLQVHGPSPSPAGPASLPRVSARPPLLGPGHPNSPTRSGSRRRCSAREGHYCRRTSASLQKRDAKFTRRPPRSAEGDIWLRILRRAGRGSLHPKTKASLGPRGRSGGGSCRSSSGRAREAAACRCAPRPPRQAGLSLLRALFPPSLPLLQPLGGAARKGFGRISIKSALLQNLSGCDPRPFRGDNFSRVLKARGDPESPAQDLAPSLLRSGAHAAERSDPRPPSVAGRLPPRACPGAQGGDPHKSRRDPQLQHVHPPAPHVTRPQLMESEDEAPGQPWACRKGNGLSDRAKQVLSWQGWRAGEANLCKLAPSLNALYPHWESHSAAQTALLYN
ncbi:uncharacterized protein LOC113597004 [Acinonyx jubatus]|uniref:Uncharacterized protein LOC113597004 n=1 Tax=Acinonyx jubatus TaxID=32536 RepID=A0ABM3P950_ACIJB|nr:uncharacterized protein LOC113597004 [Acinonyx jubatus]